jgi:hypothetical protein
VPYNFDPTQKLDPFSPKSRGYLQSIHGNPGGNPLWNMPTLQNRPISPLQSVPQAGPQLGATEDAVNARLRQVKGALDKVGQGQQPAKGPGPLDINGDGSINKLDSNPIASSAPSTQPPIQGNSANITNPADPTGGPGQMPNRPPAPSQNKPPIGVAKSAIDRKRLEALSASCLNGTMTRDDLVKEAEYYGLSEDVKEVWDRTSSGEDPKVVYKEAMVLDEYAGEDIEKQAALPLLAAIPAILKGMAIFGGAGAAGTAAYRGATGTSKGLAKDLSQGFTSWSGLDLLPTHLLGKSVGGAQSGWMPSFWSSEGGEPNAPQQPGMPQMPYNNQAILGYYDGMPSYGPSYYNMYDRGQGYGRPNSDKLRNRIRKQRKRRKQLKAQLAGAQAPSPVQAAPPAAVQPATTPAAVQPATTPATTPAAKPKPPAKPPAKAPLPFPGVNTPKPAKTPYASRPVRRGNIPKGPWGKRYKQQANYYNTQGYGQNLPPKNWAKPIKKGEDMLTLVTLEKTASDAGIDLDAFSLGFVARCYDAGMNADQTILAAEKTAEHFPELSEKLAMEKEAIALLLNALKAVPKAVSIGRKATQVGGPSVGALTKAKNFLGGFGKTVKREVGRAAKPITGAADDLASPLLKNRAISRPKPGGQQLLPFMDDAAKEVVPGVQRSLLNRAWRAPWMQPVRGGLVGNFLGGAVDDLGDITGLYDTGGWGQRLGTLGGIGFRNPFVRRLASKAPAGSATRKALNLGKGMTTYGGLKRYGKLPHLAHEGTFWAPLGLGAVKSYGENQAVNKANEMAQQMGFDSYEDMISSPAGQAMQGYNESGILGALSGVWGALTPQQKTMMLGALGLGGAGLVSALSGNTGLGLGLGAAGLGLGGYGLGAFGNQVPGNLESVIAGSNLTADQASQLESLMQDPEFSEQFYGLPKGQQSSVMQDILQQLQGQVG